MTDDGAPEHASVRRPRDAATLIMLRRRGEQFEFLMGRRSQAHVFMPGKAVFPGGAVDGKDRQGRLAGDLHPTVSAKLLKDMKGRASLARARAIAVAGLRETFEETGFIVGVPDREPAPAGVRARTIFEERGFLPDLSSLRFVARAITPPGRRRRFDARFFAVFDDAVATRVARAEDELLDLGWYGFETAADLPLPRITQLVLADLRERLRADPDLTPDAEAPYYYFRHGRPIREVL